MLLAHKIELRPTPDQVDYLEKACGHRRHCFNHLLAWFSQRDSDGNLIFKWSKKEAYQFFMKVLRVEFSWYSEISSVITRNMIEDLDNAFQHFFRRLKKGVKESFAIRDSAKFDVKNKTLRIEKLKTRIDLRQYVRFDGKLKQVTISKRAGKYYASILIDTDEYNPNDVDRQESVGVDFGIKSLAT
jgi:putative transposase